MFMFLCICILFILSIVEIKYPPPQSNQAIGKSVIGILVDIWFHARWDVELQYNIMWAEHSRRGLQIGKLVDSKRADGA